jgi:putative phosphonate catabolism associated alcohol dehydrogenase
LAGGEALVRIRCCTVCGSDLHTISGRRPAPSPSILGHEILGEIADPGPGGVRDFHGNALELGERVTWSMVLRHGDMFMKFGHEQITADRALVGGMAEYCHLPVGTAIFRVPAGLPDFAACPANCATATVAAVLRAAGPVRGERVAILGAGMLGLTACAMAREAGAAQVTAIEPDEHRRELALQFGASNDPPIGITVALEFSGQPEAFEQALELLAPGGRLILAGATFPARAAQVSAERIVRGMIRIRGVYNYEPEDLETALKFLAVHNAAYGFERLVTAQFTLNDTHAAIAYAGKFRPPRVAIIPSGASDPIFAASTRVSY